MHAAARILGVCAVVILGACATKPQQSVPLAPEAVGPQSGRIGVAMTKLPDVDTHLPGAGCLLCMATAAAANSSLTDHAKTLSYEDLQELKNADKAWDEPPKFPGLTNAYYQALELGKDQFRKALSQP